MTSDVWSLASAFDLVISAFRIWRGAFSFSVFQPFSFCPFKFQLLIGRFQLFSFSAFQHLPEQVSVCQHFSFSAFAWTDFSISAFQCFSFLSGLAVLWSRGRPCGLRHLVLPQDGTYLCRRNLMDFSFSVFQSFSFCHALAIPD
jgi:hypothetical protein